MDRVDGTLLALPTALLIAATAGAGVAVLAVLLWKDKKMQSFCMGNPKDGFSMNKIPSGSDNSTIDVIIIGAGMSGLTIASCLAQSGQSVLVLEQHDVAGGNTHTFTEKGYEFDTGLHYVGAKIGLAGSPFNKLFNYISGSNVKWAPMSDVFDVVKIAGGKDGSKADRYENHKNIKKYRQNLRDAFPEDIEAIDAYFQLVKKAEFSLLYLAIKQYSPSWLLFLIRPWLRYSLRLFQRTTLDVLKSLTDNDHLITVLTYAFGDYGEVPSKSAFGMHGVLTSHYKGGGYYPVGGSGVIAKAICGVIQQSGGTVLVRAPVSAIMVDDKTGKACGVEVKGNKIAAKTVISTVGAPLTYQKLLPEAHRHRVQRQLDCLEDPRVKSDCSFLTLFVGLDTDKDLSLPNQNIWLYPPGNPDANFSHYKKDILSNPFPIVFISFPSVKEPTYQQRFPGKQAALVITTAPWDVFAAYKDCRVRHRGPGYEKLKDQLSQKLMKHLIAEFPQVEGHVDYVELGTPLSCDYYLGNFRGASYGLAHTPGRFLDNDDLTAIRTPIKNLFLSGQDTFLDGICGAAFAGIECASILSPSFRWSIPSILLSQPADEQKK